jgi:transcriptional regulator with GAF, ATPase, and Fis domain
MLRQGFMSESDVAASRFTFAISAENDVASLEYGLRSEGQTVLEDASRVVQLPDRSKKHPTHLASMKRPRPADTKAEPIVVSRYEALMSVSVAIGAHRDIERLFSALSTELLRVVEFDFIGLSRYDHKTSRVDWHLSRPGGVIERDVIDGTKEETISAWVCEHRKPLIIPFLNQETRLHRKIKQPAREGIQSLCAVPLTCVHGCLGCVVIGSKQPAALFSRGCSLLVSGYGHDCDCIGQRH